MSIKKQKSKNNQTSNKIKQPIKSNKTFTKNANLLLIIGLIIIMLVVAAGGVYVADTFGIHSYITQKYNEYIYNLPENVAYRAQQARLLAQKQAEYTTQLAKINQWVREYDQATASAGMSEASAEARTVHITQLIADAIAHDDPVFGRIDGLLADFSTTVENVAIANSKNYYSKLLDESSGKLAKYDAELMNKKS